MSKCYTIRFKKNISKKMRPVTYLLNEGTKKIAALECYETTNNKPVAFAAGTELNLPLKQVEINLGTLYFYEKVEIEGVIEDDVWHAVPKCLLEIVPPEGTKVLPSQARESLERYVNKTEPMRAIRQRVRERWETAYREQFPSGKQSSKEIYEVTKSAIKARVSSTLTAQKRAFWEEADMLEPAFEEVQGKPEPKPEPTKPEPVVPPAPAVVTPEDKPLEEVRENTMSFAAQLVAAAHFPNGSSYTNEEILSLVQGWVLQWTDTKKDKKRKLFVGQKAFTRIEFWLRAEALLDAAHKGKINLHVPKKPAEQEPNNMTTNKQKPQQFNENHDLEAWVKRNSAKCAKFLLQAIDAGVIDACDVGFYDEPAEPAKSAPTEKPAPAPATTESAPATVEPDKDKRKMKEIKEAVLALASVKMEGSSKTDINKALQALVVKYSADHKDIAKFKGKAFYSGKSFWQQAEVVLAAHGDELAPVASAPESTTTAAPTSSSAPSWKDLKTELVSTFRAFNPELTQSKVNALIKKQLKALDCQPTGDARNASYWMDVYRAFNSADLDYEALATEGKVTQPAA